MPRLKSGKQTFSNLNNSRKGGLLVSRLLTQHVRLIRRRHRSSEAHSALPSCLLKINVNIYFVVTDAPPLKLLLKQGKLHSHVFSL